MTGLECLHEEMRRRGATSQQITSKAVGMVLDIISESKDTYINIAEAEQYLKKLGDSILHAHHKLELANRRHDEVMNTIFEVRNSAREEIESVRSECIEYVENFQKALMETETPEGRDAMRIAQMFINLVEIDTKYDNTAFIIGLSAILSGNSINAMEELKAINPKLFRENKIDPTKGARIV